MKSLHNLCPLIGLILLAMVTACTPPPAPTPQATVTRQPTRQATFTPTATPLITVAPLNPPPTATPPPIEVEPLILWEGLPPAQSEQLAADVAEFQAAYPNYPLKLNHYDNPDEVASQFLVDQTPFDIVLAPPPLLNQLWTAQQIAPMSDFFTASFMDNFAGVTLQGASREGQFWALSDTAGFHLLLFYNRDLVETPPASMAELLSQTKSLSEKSGQAALGMNSYDPLWLIPWLAPYNGWLTDEAGQPTLNTLGMEAALTNYIAWHKAKGVLPPTHYDKVRQSFVKGQLAFVIDGDWAVAELAQVNNLNWDVAPLPTLGTSSQPAAPLVLARYWAISRRVKGEQAQASAAFLTFMTRPERQLTWARQFGQLPTRREALNDPLILNDPLLHTRVNQMLAGRGLLLGVDPNRLLNAMRLPLAQALDGKTSVKAALEAMQQNIGP